VLLACGGRSIDASDEEMGSTASTDRGSEDGETTAGEGSGDSDGAGGSDGAGDSDGSCEPLTQQGPAEPTISIVLENQGENTIYVDGARGLEDQWCLGELLPFSIERVDTGETLRPEKGWCPSLCASLGDWYFCEGGACPPECPDHPPPIRIDPGGSHTIAWTAVAYRGIQLPPHCVGCEHEPVTLACDVAERLERDIDYEFSAWAGSAPDCLDCDCEPDAEGSCVLEQWGVGIAGPKVVASAITTGRPDALTIAFD
jgi:hypothetical protein